ncbi:hypothetical protein EGW08_010404 [Elysia chlorotica]|uniref:PWWP domain-containing protein n=1 Tax=Elysia chlorotica TaxID=188477 RepID=A0A3S1BE05_ELYCH|nr:hypothetical protein EGW08_010404 [Elysia chlorotica]
MAVDNLPWAHCMALESEADECSNFSHIPVEELRQAHNSDTIIGVWMSALRLKCRPKIVNTPDMVKHGVMRRSFDKLFFVRGVMRRRTASAKQRRELWSKAVRMGKALRAQHRAEDRKVLMESLAKAFPPIKKSGHRGSKNQPRKSAATHSPPPIPAVHQGDLIAVACEDRRYPALVLDATKADMIKVDFKWPNGHDIHEVSKRSIVWGALYFEPRAGGRAWLVTNAKEVQAKFQQ